MANKKTNSKSKTTKKAAPTKKKNNVDENIIVVIMILVSILLAVLIYTDAGNIGEVISPFLGGLMGINKYILPIGLFAISIFMTYKDKEYLSSKVIQYIVFLVCISTVLSVYAISNNSIQITSDLSSNLSIGYEKGQANIGGGVIGTLIASFLMMMFGQVGTIILCVGCAIVAVVFIFGFKPAEYIADKMEVVEDTREEKKHNKAIVKKERYEEIEARAMAAPINKRNKKAQSEMLNQFSELDNSGEEIYTEEFEDAPIKESKKEKLKRIKEEQRLQAEQVEDQLVINLGNEDILDEPEIITQTQKEDLFKTKEPEKEEKLHEVLQLEHALTVEDEHYEFPSIDLLNVPPKKTSKLSKQELQDNAGRLQKTLFSFGVSAKVENVCVGPAITRYELKPAEGVRVNKIANLSDDIALNLAAESIRIEAPIPGKQAVGIEVPNKENEMVSLREIIDTATFKDHESSVAFAVGKDVTGKEVVTDIAKMPHVLIAGSTGSGKSVCINTLITSIIYKSKPSDVKLVMVDPKVVELSAYNGIPHLLIPVVTDPRKAAGALAWAVQEMVNRYSLFANKNVRDIKGYNAALEKNGESGKLPQIVIIIDELADLMMVSPKDVEDAICRLAQMARAAGMNLVIATQRPSVDVITGIIKANIPSRMAFAVSSQIDSRTILDSGGAEKLLGKGDMLFYPAGANKPTRIQGAFISDKEVESIVNFVKTTGEASYNDDILEQIESNAEPKEKGKGKMDMDENDDNTDAFLDDAINTVIETGQASTSFIQRRFKVGYARAGRIIDQMEERGVISGFQGSKPREVLMTKERWAELNMAQSSQEE